MSANSLRTHQQILRGNPILLERSRRPNKSEHLRSLLAEQRAGSTDQAGPEHEQRARLRNNPATWATVRYRTLEVQTRRIARSARRARTCLKHDKRQGVITVYKQPATRKPNVKHRQARDADARLAMSIETTVSRLNLNAIKQNGRCIVGKNTDRSSVARQPRTKVQCESISAKIWINRTDGTGSRSDAYPLRTGNCSSPG